MVIKINRTYYFLRYNAAYQECISHEGNEYLSDEIEVPIGGLLLMEESISIYYNSNLNIQNYC